MEYTHPAEREAERLRVIIETLASAAPTMTMFEAAPQIFEIERKTAELERVQVVPPDPTVPGSWTGSIFHLPDDSPETLAKFVDICPPITAFMPHKKINAIKELRARTGVGLKQAKDGIEHWESSRKATITHAPPAHRSFSGTGFASVRDAADWIQHDTAGRATRDILTAKSTSHYKILAIKQCRADTSLGLKEAKEACEEWLRLYD